jgi:serine/threonine-protein kinase
MDEQRPTVVPGSRGWTPQLEGGRMKPGTRLGNRFVVLEHIGAGGGAVVATARDEQLRTIVAIKMLRSRDTELQRRFAREAEMLANVNHPSIVRVLAHGREGEDVYMALERIDGPNLGERLAEAGPLPWRQVVEIGIQIADALDTVHRKGLIHRDVKPANIMLAGDGVPLRVTLIDFGFARITEDYREPAGFTPEPRRRTDVGMAIGTPGYLPIEAGLVPADERFDVFALGVTLYELLTGALPGIEPIRPLDEVNPACDAPPDLGLVLAAALALEPEDRTQSAAELGRALEAIRTAHPERRTSTRLDGRYELLGLLGTGAKGDIYLANHRSGHDVALKFLRATDPHDLRRFEREAKLLALLDVPGLPRFFDYAPDAERPYIAMARAPGVPAVRFCRTSDKIRLKPAEVAEVGLQLAQVLAVLHERGILHRDLNANNVMIELHRTPRVTLLDLGCAALTSAYYAHASLRYLTPPEARVDIPDGGIETLAWSAPEVRAGQGWTDRSDIYSLGLLLYRLLTGKLPTMPGSDEPVPVHRVAPACAADLARVVLQTLQPCPGDRPDAVQLVMAFQDFLEDEVSDECVDVPAAGALAADTPKEAAVVAVPVLSVAGARRSRRTGAVIGLGGALFGAVVVLGVQGVLAPSIDVEPLALLIDDGPGRSLHTDAIRVPRLPSTPQPASVRDEAIHAGQASGVRRPAVSSPGPRPALRATTFAGVMAGLESKVESCATRATLERKPYTVQVRFVPGSGEVDQVRVARLDQQHDFTSCVDALVRRARPPIGDSPIESFTFFADQAGKGK